jgi:hypothetical protein
VFSATLEGESTPLAGATVSVMGTSTTATSGGDGTFSLEAPVGTVMFLTTASDSWGEILADEVGPGGLSMLDPEVIPDALVAAVEAALMETVDPAKALVGVEFNVDPVVGGESADLGVGYDFAFTFDSNGDPVVGTDLVAGGDAIVIFANVDVSADVMPTATASGGGSCALEFPSAVYSSQAKVFTAVDVICP